MRSHNGGYPIVLTSDRTLMSEYGGGLFMGFSACLPKGTVPDNVYFNLLCPSIEADKDGSVSVAPCGMRKIEAALLRSGFSQDDIIVAHPDKLHLVIGPDTKVLGLTENDPLGIGPATSTFTQILGGEPHMKLKLQELVRHPSVQKYHPRIILGGPGSWQLAERGARESIGVDCVVIGEAERVVGPLFRKAMSGEDIPRMVMGEVTPIEEIPQLEHATLNGIVEIARGCGRGCEFCVPQLQKYRCLPVENICRDVDLNLRAGRQPILHAEDVLRYGAKSIAVDEEKVVGLFRAVKGRPGVTKVGISHFALASVASAPRAVAEISEILELDGSRWLGGQTGVETGSPRLMARYMRGKCRPFECEQWPDTVVQAFQVLEDNHWVPCATIIMGLPGETESDVAMTSELVDRLHGFRSLVVPLFFVATGELNDGCKSFDLQQMSRTYSELFLNCWEHNLKWGSSLYEGWDRIALKNNVARRFIRLAYNFGSNEVKEAIRVCREEYDTDLGRIVDANRKGDLNIESMTARAIVNMVKGEL